MESLTLQQYKNMVARATHSIEAAGDTLTTDGRAASLVYLQQRQDWDHLLVIPKKDWDNKKIAVAWLTACKALCKLEFELQAQGQSPPLLSVAGALMAPSLAKHLASQPLIAPETPPAVLRHRSRSKRRNVVLGSGTTDSAQGLVLRCPQPAVSAVASLGMVVPSQPTSQDALVQVRTYADAWQVLSASASELHQPPARVLEFLWFIIQFKWHLFYVIMVVSSLITVWCILALFLRTELLARFLVDVACGVPGWLMDFSGHVVYALWQKSGTVASREAATINAAMEESLAWVGLADENTNFSQAHRPPTQGQYKGFVYLALTAAIGVMGGVGMTACLQA